MNLIKGSGLLIALLSSFSLAAQTSRTTLPKARAVVTESELKPHVGIRAGIADFDQNYQTGIDYGIDVGFQPYIPYSVSLELSQLTVDKPTYDMSGEENLSRTKLLLNNKYNFGGNTQIVRNSYLGLALGLVNDRLNGKDSLEFGLQPSVGFDIPLTNAVSKYFTLGANANYLFIGGAKPTTFALNGSLKYWF